MVGFSAKLRTLAIASALLGSVTAQATACAISHEDNVFFDHVPENIDGFVVLEATLVEPQSLGDKFFMGVDRWFFMGVARIDKVISGEIDGKTVKFFQHVENPCGRQSDKRRGIVVGTIRKGAQNELEVLTEFQWNTRAQALRERKERRGQE
jgi:hypothetical protein